MSVLDISVSVSLGELIDKFTIVFIKSKKIQDPEKLKLIEVEKKILLDKIQSLNLKEISTHIEKLKTVNLKLWEIEDEIRDCERENSFSEKFVQLARAVYKTNDERFRLKKQINEHYGSLIHEVKSYKEY